MLRESQQHVNLPGQDDQNYVEVSPQRGPGGGPSRASPHQMCECPYFN